MATFTASFNDLSTFFQMSNEEEMVATLCLIDADQEQLKSRRGVMRDAIRASLFRNCVKPLISGDGNFAITLQYLKLIVRMNTGVQEEENLRRRVQAFLLLLSAVRLRVRANIHTDMHDVADVVERCVGGASQFLGLDEEERERMARMLGTHHASFFVNSALKELKHVDGYVYLVESLAPLVSDTLCKQQNKDQEN